MPAKKHNFTLTEITAGAMVILSALVLAGFIAVISGWQKPEDTRVYYAKFTNTIGLDVGANVRFGGLLVGRVTEVQPDPDNQTRIRVRAELKPGVPVNKDSVATIEQLSLTAAKHLDISTGSEDGALLEEGDTIESITKSGGLVDIPDLSGVLDDGEGLLSDLRGFLGYQEALEKAEEEGKDPDSIMTITGDVRELMGIEAAIEEAAAGGGELATLALIAKDVRKLLGVSEAEEKAEAAGDELPSVVALTGQLGEMLERYQPNMDRIIEKVEAMQDEATALLGQLNSTLEDNRGNIDTIVADVAQILDSVNEELDGLLETLQSTLDNADRLTGEAAELLERSRPGIEDMMGDLAIMIRNLSDFTKTLKEHPEVVIRGKKQEGRM